MNFDLSETGQDLTIPLTITEVENAIVKRPICACSLIKAEWALMGTSQQCISQQGIIHN